MHQIESTNYQIMTPISQDIEVAGVRLRVTPPPQKEEWDSE